MLRPNIGNSWVLIFNVSGRQRSDSVQSDDTIELTDPDAAFDELLVASSTARLKHVGSEESQSAISCSTQRSGSSGYGSEASSSKGRQSIGE